MNSFKKSVVVGVVCAVTMFVSISIYNWHKDNFVYLPSVTSVENTNGIITLHTVTDTYVIEVSDNTF